MRRPKAPSALLLLPLAVGPLAAVPLALAGDETLGGAPLPPAPISPWRNPAATDPPPPGATRPLRFQEREALGASSPLRPQQLPPATGQLPRRFDSSLDALVRQGIVSADERARLQGARALQPIAVAAHRRACRLGALSSEECRTGYSTIWRSGAGRGVDPFTLAAAAREGWIGGPPLRTPLTVPVSALLAGGGGSFRLADVFAVTPRPAPLLGNGNRSLLFPLIGSATTSSGFGWRLHPLLGNWLMHAGKDLAAPEGTPVVAALDGRVVSSGLAGGYGLAIEVEHLDPRRRSLYGHLSELYVQAGATVRQGEVIGRVGSTGLSTGPHLHFELRLPSENGWVAVDPGDLDPGFGRLEDSDAIAQLMGQLLASLERRPQRPATASAG